MTQATRSSLISQISHRLSSLYGRLATKVAAAVVGVTVLVLVISGALSIWAFTQEHRRTITSLHQQQAEAAAQRISGFVEQIEVRVRELIAPTWSSLSQEDRYVDALRALRALPAVNALSVIDPEQREQVRVARLSPDVVGSGKDVSSMMPESSSKDRRTTIGPVYFKDASEPFVTLYVGSRGDRGGTVIAEVNLKLIWNMIVSIKIGDGGRVYVVDAAGRLIAHPDISLVLRQFDMSHLPQVAAALAGSQGSRVDLVEGRSIDSEAILSSHAIIPSLSWVVVTEISRSEAFAPLYASIWLSAAALLIGLAAAIALGILVTRPMRRSIGVLMTGASRIGGGALDHRIAVAGSDELAQLGARFNQMAEKLQLSYLTLEEKVRDRTAQLAQANQAKSRFLATASHDLRQPLHALSLFVDELQSSPHEKRRLELHRNLAAAITGLGSMFESILDTSKIEANAVQVSLTDFPISDILTNLAGIFGPMARAKGLALEVAPCTAWTRSDPILLHRILQNLVSNAIRYTESGSVDVVCRCEDEQLRVAVRDTGVGIPLAAQQEVFTEFFRLTSVSLGSERGLGLGLFIVERFSRLLGHPIVLHSQLGAGTTIELCLPVVDRDVFALDQRLVQRATALGEGRRVAVVEDDELAREAVCGILRSWAFEVVSSANVDDFRKAWSSVPCDVDLLISDYDLGSKETGLDLLIDVRCKVPSLPAIIMTAKVEALPHEARATIGFDFLPKPVLPISLRAAVTRALSDSGRPRRAS